MTWFAFILGMVMIAGSLAVEPQHYPMPFVVSIFVSGTALVLGAAYLNRKYY